MTARLSRRRLLRCAGAAAAPVALSAAGVSLALVAGRPGRARLVAGATMGTRYAVTVPAHGGGPPREVLAAETAQVLSRVDALMSFHREDSDVGRVNDAPAGQRVEVAPETAYVVALALEVASQSGGAFDPTVGAAVDLWGFGPSPAGRLPPEPARCAAAREAAGYRGIEVSRTPPSIRKARRETRLDLGGVAKGYALDLLAARLSALGVTDFLIDVGGELLARGGRSPGTPWRVAVERPARAPEREAGAPAQVLRVLTLSGAGLATSGDGRRGAWASGRWWSHLFDPSRGEPVGPALASVTVRAAEVAVADAWATALMALGPERGPEVARARGLAALFVRRAPAGLVVETVGAVGTVHREEART